MACTGDGGWGLALLRSSPNHSRTDDGNHEPVLRDIDMSATSSSATRVLLTFVLGASALARRRLRRCAAQTCAPSQALFDTVWVHEGHDTAKTPSWKAVVLSKNNEYDPPTAPQRTPTADEGDVSSDAKV